MIGLLLYALQLRGLDELHDSMRLHLSCVLTQASGVKAHGTLRITRYEARDQRRCGDNGLSYALQLKDTDKSSPTWGSMSQGEFIFKLFGE